MLSVGGVFVREREKEWEAVQTGRSVRRYERPASTAQENESFQIVAGSEA